MDNPLNNITRSQSSEHPGTEGLWIFVFLDMMIFFLMFITYISEHVNAPAVFAASQHQLNVAIGLANTLILLTSSWLMVEAVEAARLGSGKKVARNLSLCLVFGALFAINKVFEYYTKIEHGITPATNVFFTLYFVITGIHFLHVIGGMIFILVCRTRATRDAGKASFQKTIENVGLFWHFVDVLWVFIFPMLYLAGLQ